MVRIFYNSFVVKKIIQHPEIGTIELCSRNNLRGTRFRVTADKVRITTNPIAYFTVFPLSKERVAWILEAKKKLATQAKIQNFAPETELRANRFTLKFAPNQELKTSFVAQRSDQELIIFFRPEIDFESAENQQKIKHIIAHFLKIDAQRILPNRLKNLAEKHGFAFSEMRINSAQTRWGSCSSKKQINLSYNIMLLPDALVDFVLVHELCHTREMNHGEHFKTLMRSIFPNYDELNKALKHYHTLHL